jgi:cell wall-associated NlpC family hydrolase
MRSTRLAGGLAALAVLVLLLTAGPALAADLPAPNPHAATVAQLFLDVPYKDGGFRKDGVDVAGFTRLVYHRLGIWLPQDVERQSQRGVAVSSDQLKPGDLVFDAALQHVGVYEGEGNVITMPGPDAVVSRHSMADWGEDVTFRRLRCATGARIAKLVTRCLGVPYVYGGANMQGFDCSGLTKFAYGRVGVWLAHGATAQQKACTRIPLNKLRPGDLVFFGKASYSHHVGIYTGGGRMIHAPHAGTVVRYGRITGAWIGGRLLPAR